MALAHARGFAMMGRLLPADCPDEQPPLQSEAR